MFSGRSMINVSTARLVKAREVALIEDAGTWRVAGIVPSVRAGITRLLPRRYRGHQHEHGRVRALVEDRAVRRSRPDARGCGCAPRRLAPLHPAQIADLVEAASHDEGEEIMQAVGHDKELEADVFEELDDEHQVEFLKERPDEEVAAGAQRGWRATTPPICCSRSSRTAGSRC